MAEQKLGSLFGESLVTLLDWAWPRLEPKVDAAFEFVSEVVRPQPPMTIRTEEGDAVTGLLVVERGRVLVFLGTRHRVSASSHSSRERIGDEPLWQHGDSYSPR